MDSPAGLTKPAGLVIIVSQVCNNFVTIIKEALYGGPKL